MSKKALTAVAVVFVVWVIMDFLIHGVLLQSLYAAAGPGLFRPQEEMNMVLMYFVVFVGAFVFVSIYSRFFGTKDRATGLKYGLWYGLGVGIGMGYGTYSVMPISYFLALGWFLGTLVEAGVAGFIVGSMVKE